MINDWKIGDSNKSQIFILPFLSDTYRDFVGTRLPYSQYRNCFIGDTVKNIENKILLLYKFHADPSFLEFEDELGKHSLFDCKYEVDRMHTMFVFNIPEKYVDDYNKIIKGEYSKISSEFKKRILEFHGMTPSSNTGGILYKSDNKRQELEEKINEGIPSSRWTRIPSDAELLDCFDLQIEMFHKKYAYQPSILPNEEFTV